MPRKPKFKPVITRIKLNPEQAVLACSCYPWGQVLSATTHYYYYVSPGYVICSGRTFTTHHSTCGDPYNASTALDIVGSVYSS